MLSLDEAHGGHENLKRAVRRRPPNTALEARLGELEHAVWEVGFSQDARVVDEDASASRRADPTAITRTETRLDFVEQSGRKLREAARFRE